MNRFITILFIVLTAICAVNKADAQLYIGQNLYIQEAIPPTVGGYNNQLGTITSGSTRNNITGHVGFRFTVGSSNLVVGTLQRMCMGSTSTTAHTIYIVSSSGIVTSGVVDMTGIVVGGYASVSITPVTLTAGTTYILCSNESTDLWYDLTPISLSGATSPAAVFMYNGPPVNTAGFSISTAGDTFGGVNLKFQ